MAWTKLVTVSSTQPTPITVDVPCSRVTIGEDGSVPGSPTTDWLLAKPANTNTFIRLRIGDRYTFFADRGLFQTGDVIGYIQAVAGATTFFVDEGGSEVGHG